MCFFNIASQRMRKRGGGLWEWSGVCVLVREWKVRELLLRAWRKTILRAKARNAFGRFKPDPSLAVEGRIQFCSRRPGFRQIAITPFQTYSYSVVSDKCQITLHWDRRFQKVISIRGPKTFGNESDATASAERQRDLVGQLAPVRPQGRVRPRGAACRGPIPRHWHPRDVPPRRGCRSWRSPRDARPRTGASGHQYFFTSELARSAQRHRSRGLEGHL